MRQLLTAVAFVVSLADSSRADQGIDGVWEGEIQDPQRPVVVSVDFSARSVSLSGRTPAEMTRLAPSPDGRTVEFEIANGGQTLKFAGNRLDTRINGDLDASGSKIPFWIEHLPELPPPANRVEAWRQDLGVVSSRFLLYDHSFTEAGREAARKRLQALSTTIDQRSDAAVMVELARTIAMAGNAHTRLYLIRNRTEVRRIPLRVWWFGDELRVVRAGPGHERFLGGRVTAIGQWNVSEAFQKMGDIKAGNASWQRYMSAYFLTSPDLLFGAGLIPDPEHLPLTIVNDDRTQRVEFFPMPLRRSSTPVEAWWDLAPSHPHADAELKSALPIEKAPLYLQHPDQNYRVEYLSKSGIVYLQYYRAQEMSGEPMTDFISHVTRLIGKHSVQGLVVDVRFNTGGDAGVGTPLVDTLAARLKGVPVIVLTGRSTFSAGITHAAQWRQIANATIIGEPVGDGLDMWSEGGNLVLPNSGLTVHYANGFHAYSQRDYPEFQPYFSDLNVATLEPDERVETTWREYMGGRDPLLEAAVRILKRR